MKATVKEKFSDSQPIQAWLSSMGQNNLTMATKEIQSENMPQNRMLKSMKCLLCFGKIVGFLPVSGIFTAKTGYQLTVNKRSVFGVFSLVLIFLLTFQFLVTVSAFFYEPVESNPHAIAQRARSLVHTAAGLYGALFHYKNAETLISCICAWEETDLTYYKEDRHLPLAVNLLTALIIFSTIGENLVAHATVLVAHFHEGNNESIIQDYWELMHPDKVNMIPYNAVIAVILFITDKLTSYIWNYGDLLVSTCAIQLYRRFQLQNEKMMEHLEVQSDEKQMWEAFVEDHNKLVKLMRKFQSFLSPVVFVVVFSNIFFMAMHVSYFFRSGEEYDIKYGDFHAWRQVYVAWGFIHIVTRVFIVCLSCGKVSKHAHKFAAVLDKCPASCFCGEVERAELKLRTESLGFGGLNLFTMTDAFILQALNVMFTIEIVLLQSSGMTKRDNKLSTVQ